MNWSEPEDVELIPITVDYLDNLGFMGVVTERNGSISPLSLTSVRLCVFIPEESLAICSIDIMYSELEWRVNAIIRDDGGESHREMTRIDLYDPDSFSKLGDAIIKRVKNSLGYTVGWSDIWKRLTRLPD